MKVKEFFEMSLSQYRWGPELEIDYDHYGCHGCDACSGIVSDFCRSSVYENLRVTAVHSATAFLKKVFKVSVKEATELQETLGLLDPKAYEVRTQSGFYGEEYDVYLADSVKALLANYWMHSPNAIDTQGLYEYLALRGKRYLGFSPIECLKKSLQEENGGKVVKEVEEATQASLQSFYFHKVRIPNEKHYAQIEGKFECQDLPTQVVGVVVRMVEGEFKLVDGYHRLKYMKEKNKFAGNFYVME